MEAALSYANVHPLMRSGGLFVMLIGAAMVLGSIWFRSRNVLLVLGATLATVAVSLSAARLTAPYGVPTFAQVAWLVTAVVAEAIALVLVIRSFAPRGERAVLLAILVVVGFHFLPMAPAFSPFAAVLGVACAVNAFVAMRISGYPLRAVWATDGGLKLAVGALMWWIPLVGTHGTFAG